MGDAPVSPDPDLHHRARHCQSRHLLLHARLRVGQPHTARTADWKHEPRGINQKQLLEVLERGRGVEDDASLLQCGDDPDPVLGSLLQLQHRGSQRRRQAVLWLERRKRSALDGTSSNRLGVLCHVGSTLPRHRIDIN